ncbi:MAG: hypothetical protein J6T94_04215 [Bacteroidaceae bacterium]|nr:hypothetical protein [Bacteroidaceae bacterium]MBP5323262.1 hypothetical protein [Bacteroidaceae bacterium]
MKNLKIKKVLALCVVLLVAQTGFAQSWNTMAKWVQNYGWKEVATVAHPNDDVVSHSVSYDDETVYVTIVFDDIIPFAPNYTCKYEIRKGVKSGVNYFRTIAVPSEGFPAAPSFSYFMQHMVSDQVMKGYNTNGYASVYGVEQWYDLSLGQKAAVYLMSKFLEYYED